VANRFCSFVALTSAVLLASGCGEYPTCPQWSFPAVSLRVTSAATGAPLVDARGEVRDGDYRDSLENFLDGSYQAAPNRPGTYSVHLEQAGYAPWDTSGMAVQAVGGDVCTTVDTEFATARLEPAP
jgi:hypothetical protein